MSRKQAYKQDLLYLLYSTHHTIHTLFFLSSFSFFFSLVSIFLFPPKFMFKIVFVVLCGSSTLSVIITYLLTYFMAQSPS